MKIKGQNLLMIAAALSVLTLLILVGPAKAWRWGRAGPQPGGLIAVEKTRTPSSTEQGPTTEDFDRLMVRDIGTVPFVELLELLRSASPKIRAEWIRQLDEMPEGPRRTAALSSFYKTFVQLDPHAAAESITGLHKKYSQAIAVGAMVGAVPQSAMGEMAGMLVKLPSDIFGRGSPDYLGNVIYDWGAVDPSAAARFLEENPEAHYAESLLLNWARLEPDAAKAWLEAQPESVQTESAIDGLIVGWFQRDEANASTFAVAHAGEEKFRRAINDIAFELMVRSPDEARTFLLRLPNEARNLAVREIGMFTPRNGTRTAEEVARWLITLPKDSWRESMETVLDHWDSQNSAGFSAWLDQLPPETRDEIVAAYCFSGTIKEHERAIPLLIAMSDPTLRDQALRKYIAGRFPSSRDKAMAVINQSALSQAQKKQLIDLLPQEQSAR